MHELTLLSLILLSQSWADPSSPLDSPGGTNFPARPPLRKGWDLSLSADALYWQAVEDNLIFAYSGNQFQMRPEKRTIHSPHFDWNWGFRLNAGYDFARDGWDLSVHWTHIRNTAEGKVNLFPTNHYTFQVWLNPFFTTFSIETIKWHATLDQVDLQCGREFFAGRYLTIRPYFGIRSTWLPQQVDLGKKGIPSDSSPYAIMSFKNDFWGLGFVAGLDSDWELGRGFSLYALSDFSILCGFFKIIEQSHPSLNPQGLDWDWKKSFRASRGVLDLGMGLKWAHLFCKESFGIAFKIGYEYHLYFDQNQFIFAAVKSTAPETNAFSTESSNLTYQGVAGAIQFDF